MQCHTIPEHAEKVSFHLFPNMEGWGGESVYFQIFFIGTFLKAKSLETSW